MAEDTLPNLFFVRQPIFDRKMEVLGYDLQFYPLPVDPPITAMDDPRVVQALLELVANTGLTHMVGDKKAFVPAYRNLIFRLPSAVLPPEATVLQIEKDAPLDNYYLEHLARLVKMGYTVSLDQVNVVNEWVAHMAQLVQYMKVPFHGHDPNRVMSTVGQVKATRLKVIAQAVEVYEEQVYANRLGCDFVQGMFFTRPRQVINRKIDASTMAVLRTLTLIQDPSSDFPRLGRLIAQDARLSQRLLSVVNSLSYSLPNPVSSLEQAVAYMGLTQLRSWMTLLTMASIPGKPAELTSMAILRARMCELLGQSLGVRSDTFFVVGLFSVLDALLDVPMSQALTKIALSEEAMDALVSHQGLPGQLLMVARVYEQANWSWLFQTSLKPDVLSSSYLHAARWATEVSSSVTRD